MVYITFKNDYDDKKVIDHIDGNKLNNNLSNLRCISQSENIKNAYKNNDKMYQNNKIEILDSIQDWKVAYWANQLKNFNCFNYLFHC